MTTDLDMASASVIATNGSLLVNPHYRALEDFILASAPIWQERMGLSHYEITHVFLDSYFGDDGEEDFKVTACTESRWNYLQAKVKWYLPSAIRHPEEHLELTLVHELCHVLLAPEQTLIDARMTEHSANPSTSTEYDQLQKAYYERMELATEMTARAIWNAFNA